MCRLLLMTFAFLLVLFGISGLIMMPKILQQKIEQRMQLKMSSSAFDRFTTVPIPLTVKFYLFNVTNSDRVLQGEQPIFKEVGPFMYKQWRRRKVLDFEDNMRKVKYKEYKTYYPVLPQHQQYDNEASSNNSSSSHTTLPLDPNTTNVTLINVPLLAILTQMASMEPGSFKRGVATTALTRLIESSGEKILINKRVSQFLFEGYKVALLESLSKLVHEVSSMDFPSPLPGNTFGFFYGRNGTWNKQMNGVQTIFTGRNDSMKDFMLVDSWNDERELKTWRKDTIAGNRCNEIRGTDGSQFHPGLNKDQILDIFNPLICSSIQIKYKEDTSARGIPLLRFTPHQVFAAPMKSKNHACYCTIPDSTSTNNSHAIPNDRCYRDGIIDLSLCQKGAPIAGSFPHFYQGDSLLSTATGLKPNQAIHETYVDIEPMTGTVMRAAARAQMNAFVEKAVMNVINVDLIGNLTPMVAPMLWVEEFAEIDEPSANEFKSKLLFIVQKSYRAFVGAIIIGIVLAIIVSIHFWYFTCHAIPLDRPNRKLKQQPKRRSQLQSNLRLATSRNRGLREPAASSKNRPEHVHTEIDESSIDNPAIPVLVAAVALGAGSAGTTTKHHAKSRKIRASHATGSKANEDEDELNKKLMTNEWDVGQVSSNTTTSSDAGISRRADDIDHSNDDDDDDEDVDESSIDYLDEEVKKV